MDIRLFIQLNKLQCATIFSCLPYLLSMFEINPVKQKLADILERTAALRGYL